MANSVIFSNGHPSERSHGFVGVGQKHLDKDKDFDLMVGLMVLVNNAEINVDKYSTAIITTVDQTNINIDEGIIDVDENNTYMDSNISDMTEVVNVSDSSSNNPTESGDMVSVESSNGDSVASPSSTSQDSSSSSTPDAEPLSKSECKELVMEYLENSDCEIEDIEQNGDIYVFHIIQDDEDVGVITVDAKTGDLDDTGLTV